MEPLPAARCRQASAASGGGSTCAALLGGSRANCRPIMMPAACQRLATAPAALCRGRRALRTGRATQQIVSQARKGLSELLSLSNK